MLQKSIFKSIFIFALIGFAFSSCQKEEAKLVNEPIKQITETGYSINVNKEFPQKEKPNGSKFPITKPGVVEVMNSNYASSNTCLTKKVRKHDGTNYQEWIMVDLTTDYYDYKYWDTDVTGSDYGYFYTWHEGGYGPLPLETNYDNAFDYLIYNADYSTIEGFHIPTHDDLMTLGATLGNTNKIPGFLELKEDGLMRFHEDPNDGDGFYYTDNPTDTELYTTMWVDLRQDGSYGSHYNANTDCGIYAWFVHQYDDELHYFLTTIPNLRARIRLVRDLPANEW